MAKFPENIGQNALKLEPAEAVAFFEKKKLKVTWNWEDQLKLNQAQIFTVAKAMKMSVLQDIRDMVKDSLKQGTTLEQFKKDLEPKLRAKGWWGKGIDPTTGKKVLLGSPHRLKTIYDTNVQGAFNAGRWKRQQDNKVNRPFLEYVAVLDSSTRPSHAALDGTIKPVDSPFWNTYYPPNGYNCRCRTRALTKVQTEKKGGVTKKPPSIKPDKGFSQNVGKKFWEPKKSRYDSDIWKIGQPIKS